MTRRRTRTKLLGSLLLVAPLAALAGAPAHAAVPTVTVTSYDFQVGYPATPAGSTTPVMRQCNVVGDLYVPSDASPTHREPAILTTNGFGGSRADQASTAKALGADGYITLSYSGLGFGGSGCPITDDDPNSDGIVASQLVSFLGGKTGIAFTGFSPAAGWSGAVPAVDNVIADTCDHSAPTPKCGADDPNDPRLGMIGGSYGGEIQFAAAGDDPRIDTIVPQITWHDLSYSLDPGNSALPGDTLAPGLPGVAKREWDNFFFGLGVAATGGVSTSAGAGSNPQALNEPQPATANSFGATDAMCPGYQPETCTAEVETDATGYADSTAQQFFTHSSVTSYLPKINIPVFFQQGEEDSLFNLQEASATYTALKARGVPVKMDWQSWGHSRIGPAPGELPYASDDASTTLLQTFQGQQIGQWFDHYLKNTGTTPALDFSYFRDYDYHPTGTAGAANEPAAAAAYGNAPSFPTGSAMSYHLSGTGALVPADAPVTTGAGSFTAVPGGPTSVSIVDASGVVGSYTNPVPQPPATDAPGTFASWTSPALAADTDVVGMPTLDVAVSSGEAQTAGNPGSDLVMFAKLYDLAPDGTTVTLPEHLISPVRVTGLGAAGTTTTVHVTLPGIVYRFPKGDSLRVILASGDSAYAGNLTPRTATFPTSAQNPGIFTIPVAADETTATTATSTAKVPAKKATVTKKKVKKARAAVKAVQPTRTLAFTGINPGLGYLALVMAAMAGVLTLIRRRGGRSRG